MNIGLYKNARYHISGDCGLLVEYGDTINLSVNCKVRSMAIVVKEKALAGVLEIIPTYLSILIIYDPLITNPSALQQALMIMEDRLHERDIPQQQTIEIPVCYGEEFGPDIQFVAKHNSMTEDDVVRIHSESVYQIYMIGFTPGFPFLGGLSKKLYTPRLETPRSLVPAGSVGIANEQTGIYPIDSPGGWQLIGRTPITLFAPEKPNPFLYQTGDRIKFKPVSTEEYFRLAARKER